MIEVLRWFAFIFLFLPVIIRFFVVKKPLPGKKAVQLAIVYSLALILLTNVLSIMSMLRSIGDGAAVPPLEEALNVVKLFSTTVATALLYTLVFYGARFVLKYGYKLLGDDYSSESKLENWWLKFWPRLLLFFVVSGVIVLGCQFIYVALL